MPLKYLIERETVDHGLHAGTISDTELAAADKAAHDKKTAGWRDHPHHHDAKSMSRNDPSCSPFC